MLRELLMKRCERSASLGPLLRKVRTGVCIHTPC